MLTALVRPVSPSLADCELTYLAREPIDVARAVAQHRAYLEYLGALGARLVRLPAAPHQLSRQRRPRGAPTSRVLATARAALLA